MSFLKEFLQHHWNSYKQERGRLYQGIVLRFPSIIWPLRFSLQTANATQAQGDFDTSMLVRSLTDVEELFFITQERMWKEKRILIVKWGSDKKITTHRRSRHSWHILWLSTACSSSPSPEGSRWWRNREQKKKGRKKCESIHKETNFQMQLHLKAYIKRPLRES